MYKDNILINYDLIKREAAAAIWHEPDYWNWRAVELFPDNEAAIKEFMRECHRQRVCLEQYGLID